MTTTASKKESPTGMGEAGKAATYRGRLSSIGNTLNELTIVVAFAVISLYLALTTPTFLTTANMLSILLATSLIGIVAVGETFVIITAGIDLSVGSVVAFSGVMAGLALEAHWSVPVAVATGIGIGVLCGVFNAVAITILGMNPFIVTLAVLAMARGLAFIVTSGNTVFGFPDAFDNIGGGNWGIMPIAALITLGTFLVAWIVLSRTVFGARIYAVGGNRDAARLAGIPVGWTLAAAYIISGALAGLGGVVLAGRLELGPADRRRGPRAQRHRRRGDRRRQPLRRQGLDARHPSGRAHHRPHQQRPDAEKRPALLGAVHPGGGDLRRRAPGQPEPEAARGLRGEPGSLDHHGPARDPPLTLSAMWQPRASERRRVGATRRGTGGSPHPRG